MNTCSPTHDSSTIHTHIHILWFIKKYISFLNIGYLTTIIGTPKNSHEKNIFEVYSH